MRITINHPFILFVLLVQACSGTDRQANPEAIYAYIETQINQRKSDARLYDPPPPPELQDRAGHSGRMKPDSIINKLPPLKIHIDPLVNYDSILPQGNWGPREDLSFIDERQNSPLRLNSDQFSKKEGILIRTMEPEEFFSTHRASYLEEGYGGYVSFHNLYSSRNGQMAYFEVRFFKGKLNAAVYGVLCTKQADGSWEFMPRLLNIS